MQTHILYIHMIMRSSNKDYRWTQRKTLRIANEMKRSLCACNMKTVIGETFVGVNTDYF